MVSNYDPDKEEGVGLSRSVLGSDLPYLNPCQSEIARYISSQPTSKLEAS